MEIRITGTCQGKCWYNEKQGQVFTVIEPPKGWCNDNVYAYCVEHPENKEGQTYFVWKEDCEELAEIEEANQT